MPGKHFLLSSSRFIAHVDFVLQLLALCAATFMYLVSLDRFTIDIDETSAQLMFRLLQCRDPDPHLDKCETSQYCSL